MYVPMTPQIRSFLSQRLRDLKSMEERLMREQVPRVLLAQTLQTMQVEIIVLLDDDQSKTDRPAH